MLVSLLLTYELDLRFQKISKMIHFKERSISAFVEEPMRGNCNLLHGNFLIVNFTKSISTSDKFRVMNSVDDLEMSGKNVARVMKVSTHL